MTINKDVPCAVRVSDAQPETWAPVHYLGGALFLYGIVFFASAL